jgi:signal transduction histidine kinase
VRILIDNALRFAPAHSSIEIMPCHDRDFAQILVCDQGPGVPPAERERIFERFTRGRQSVGRGAGFGLGLAIGRELALRMSGSLELVELEQARCTPDRARASERNGVAPGACFALRLPSIPAEQEAVVT